MEFNPSAKEGEQFIFKADTFHRAFKEGDIATLFDQDGSMMPCFTTNTGFKTWVGWDQLDRIK